MFNQYLLLSFVEFNNQLKMRSAVNLIIAIFISFILFFNNGCKKEESPGSQFIIQVDSIVHPDTIFTGDALEIKFYGLIGDTKCFSFYKFDTDFDNDIINAVAIGLNSENEDCEESDIFLNGESLNIVDLPAGIFTILVKQQRGNQLESQVHVVQQF